MVYHNRCHTYPDAVPMKGNNFYRLRIVDNNSRESFSGIVLLVNDHVINLRLYPNPFKDYVMLHADAGRYLVKIIDLHGKNILTRPVDANGADIKLPLASLGEGAYFFSVNDENGNSVLSQKLIKQ